MSPQARPIALWTGVLAAFLPLVIPGATAQQSGAPGARALVLAGGTLIDGTGRAPVTDAVVVVQGNRIMAVGRRGQVAIPANANVINTAGRTILPGLIDSHVHSQQWHMPMFPDYGVTTMADQNNDTAWIFAEREALQKGRINGPRMFVAGTAIFGNLYRLPGENLKLPNESFNFPAVNTVAEARAAAKAVVAGGADIVKINSSLSDEQLRATTEVAEAAGLPSFGHTQNIRRAAELGFKFTEHMETVARALLDPEDKLPRQCNNCAKPSPVPLMDPKQFPPLIAYLVKQGVYMNPTLSSAWSPSTPLGQKIATEAQRLAKDPELGFVPANIRKNWAEPLKARGAYTAGYSNVATFLRQFSEAGGKIIVGTDAGTRQGNIPGLSEHYEMQMIVGMGIPAMKAIQGATLWNAQMLKKDKELGSVETGKLADLLIVEGDPLKDISATRNIRMVIKDGKVMDTRYDPKWVNPVPQPYSSFLDDLPKIAKLSPAAAPQGGKSLQLRIEGSAFKPDAIVYFGDTVLPTHFVNDGQLTATLDAKALQKSPGSYPLYVLNPGPSGTISIPSHFQLGEAAPQDTSLEPWPLFGPNPRMARQGGKSLTLEIQGGQFTRNSVVHFDRDALPTRFVSSTKLTATLDTRLLQRHAGGYVLYVVDPGPQGSVSAPGYFLVNLKD